MTEPEQSKGREENGATPGGERPGLVSPDGVKRTGEASRKAAAPDGPDAGVVGETFKKAP